jgi:aspartate carbamoyltransferase catalytic subunit
MKNVEIIFVSPPVCKMEGDIKAYLDKNNVPWREETDLAKVAPEVDCVYMTRIQKERFHNPEDYKAAAGKIYPYPGTGPDHETRRHHHASPAPGG